MNDSVKEKKPNSTQSNKPAPQRTSNQYTQGDKADQRWASTSLADAPHAQSSRSQSHSTQQRQAQPPAGMFNTAAIKAQWKHMLNSVRKTWGDLTDVEIVKTGGDEQKRTGPVKERYDMPREEANKPAKSFFAKSADK